MSTDTIVKASNWRLVEVGRVVLNKKTGKLATIVEIVDQKKVLVDGPETVREVLFLAQVVLTPLTFSLPRGARSAVVAKKFTAAGVTEKWNQTAWAKKIAQRQRRAALTDFERFQVMVLRKQKRYSVKKTLAKA
ncbi:large ribosomal subunit protein eL14B [Monosporozyma servazzii]